MTIYYPTGCDSVTTDHYCNPCDPQEGARVRSAFFVKISYEFTDPTDPAEWDAAIENGDVIVIPETNGTFDGGTAKYGTGYGNAVSVYINSEFKSTYTDPNYKQNCSFYEGLKTSRSWKFGYRTETLIHIGDTAAIVVAKAPVADDLQGQVNWSVDVSWISRNYPCPHDVPAGIFDACFMVS